MALITGNRLRTVGIAAIGAGLFLAAGLPLPFLFGPMAACLLAALALSAVQTAIGLHTLQTALATP